MGISVCVTTKGRGLLLPLSGELAPGPAVPAGLLPPGTVVVICRVDVCRVVLKPGAAAPCGKLPAWTGLLPLEELAPLAGCWGWAGEFSELGEVDSWLDEESGEFPDPAMGLLPLVPDDGAEPPCSGCCGCPG